MNLRGDEDTGKKEKEKAIKTLRRYFRGYLAREKVYQMREKELLFLGIEIDINDDPNDKNSETYKLLQN